MLSHLHDHHERNKKPSNPKPVNQYVIQYLQVWSFAPLSKATDFFMVWLVTEGLITVTQNFNDDSVLELQKLVD